jgi:ketosteroid isomerase-like protein
VSEGNVELHRKLVAVFNARDVETLIASFDPEIELHGLFAALGGVTTYNGRAGVRKWLGDLEEAWREIRAEPEAYFDLGEHTLMFYVLRGRGRQSAAETTMHFAQVARWRDGLCVYYKAYTQRQDALRDLGVSEDELEPIDP